MGHQRDWQAAKRQTCRPSYEGEEKNRLYGDVWLLEQTAEKTEIREDLEKVFDGNKEIVADILTLAMFPYITNFSYSRLARWQNIPRHRQSRPCSPPT